MGFSPLCVGTCFESLGEIYWFFFFHSKKNERLLWDIKHGLPMGINA